MFNSKCATNNTLKECNYMGNDMNVLCMYSKVIAIILYNVLCVLSNTPIAIESHNNCCDKYGICTKSKYVINYLCRCGMVARAVTHHRCDLVWAGMQGIRVQGVLGLILGGTPSFRCQFEKIMRIGLLDQPCCT